MGSRVQNQENVPDRTAGIVELREAVRISPADALTAVRKAAIIRNAATVFDYVRTIRLIGGPSMENLKYIIEGAAGSRATVDPRSGAVDDLRL